MDDMVVTDYDGAVIYIYIYFYEKERYIMIEPNVFGKTMKSYFFKY